MLKDTLAKANTSVKLIKLDFKDAAIHKPVDLDLGFAVKFDLNSLKCKGRYSKIFSSHKIQGRVHHVF